MYRPEAAPGVLHLSAENSVKTGCRILGFWGLGLLDKKDVLGPVILRDPIMSEVLCPKDEREILTQSQVSLGSQVTKFLCSQVIVTVTAVALQPLYRHL